MRPVVCDRYYTVDLKGCFFYLLRSTFSLPWRVERQRSTAQRIKPNLLSPSRMPFTKDLGGLVPRFSATPFGIRSLER